MHAKIRVVNQGLIKLRLAIKQRLLQFGSHVHERTAQVLAGIVYFVASFFINKFYVFRAPEESGP